MENQLAKIDADTPLLIMKGLSPGSEYTVLSNGHGPEENMHVAARFREFERENAGMITLTGTIRLAYDATYNDSEGVVVEFKTPEAIASAFPDTTLAWANQDERRSSTYFMFGFPLNVYSNTEDVDKAITPELVERLLDVLMEGCGIKMVRNYRKTVLAYLHDKFITSAKATLATVPEVGGKGGSLTAEIGGEVVQFSDFQKAKEQAED